MDNLSKELTIDMITDGDSRTIAEAIGVENFYKLCEAVGGATIYLPKPEASSDRPRRHIKAELTATITRSSPEIQRHRALGTAACGDGKLEGQLELFDILTGTDGPGDTT